MTTATPVKPTKSKAKSKTKKTGGESELPSYMIHPNYFYRSDNPDAPLRSATPVTSHYVDTFEFFRKKFLSATGYEIKKSKEAFSKYQNLTDIWDDCNWEGDRAADSLANSFREKGGSLGRKQFEKALEEGISSVDSPSEELVDFFKEVDAIPELFDLDKAQRAADHLADLPLFVLYTANLSMAWMSSNLGSVGRMVGATGRFFDVQKSAARFVETAKYVIGDVSSSDVYQRSSESLKDACRVRLMHALIRTHSMKNTNKEIFDFSERGNPMGMKQSIFAGPTFVLYPMFLNKMLGGELTAQQLDDAVELSNLIAYTNGVDHKVLPKTIIEYALFSDATMAMHEGVGPFAKELNQAFYKDFPEFVANNEKNTILKKFYPLLTSFLTGIMQWTYGEKLYSDMPGMPKRSKWGAMILPVYKVFRIGYDAVDKILPGYQTRILARRKRHRDFASDGFLKMILKMVNSEKLSMKFDGHDTTKASELSAPSK